MDLADVFISIGLPDNATERGKPSDDPSGAAPIGEDSALFVEHLRHYYLMSRGNNGSRTEAP